MGGVFPEIRSIDLLVQFCKLIFLVKDVKDAPLTGEVFHGQFVDDRADLAFLNSFQSNFQ